MCSNPSYRVLAFSMCALPILLAGRALGQVGSGIALSRDSASRPQLPFTAEFKTTTVQILASGTTISRTTKETQARDSEGRTMFSRTPETLPNRPSFTHVTINDPVEGTRITWDSGTKIAEVIKMPPQSDRHGCWQSASGNFRMNYGPFTRPGRTLHPETTASSTMVRGTVASPSPREDLGSTMIQGIEAHGWRSTITIPAGQIGNDQPLVTTNESWTSSSLGLEVLHISDSPQSGKSTTQLVSIDLREPPLSTFQPPDGYQVTTDELHPVACPESQAASR